MRKNDPRYNAYLKRRLRSLEKQRLKHARKNCLHVRFVDSSSKQVTDEDMFVSIVPEVFSIIDNTAETIRYFNNLIHNILRSERIKRIFFQFENVKQIRADALMYLLAILKFAKSNVWEFLGNIPIESEPKEVFLNSGFLKMITNSRVPVERRTETCFMCSGKQASGNDSAAVCKFLHNHSSATRRDTGFLYDMLMELEVNTDEHAYKKNANPIFDTNWILSVEDAGDTFKFAFLDVGVGICKTVYKRWHELINIGNTQADYLASAFNGVLLRSETQSSHRGKGLPKIKKYADKHLISHLRVVANKAICYFDDEGTDAHGKLLSESLNGSVYYWEIPKSQFEKKGVIAA